MKDFSVEQLLEQIYNIDEKGIEYRKKIENVDTLYHERLLEQLKDLEREYMKVARKTAKRKTKAILHETIEEEQGIMDSCYEETDRLDNILENNKEELILEVFHHVFLEEE